MRQMSAVVNNAGKKGFSAQHCLSTVSSHGPLGLQNITLQFNHCPNNCSVDEQTACVTHAIELMTLFVGHWFNARVGRAPLDDSKVFYCPPRPITIVQSFFLSHLQLLKDIQAVHLEFKTFTTHFCTAVLWKLYTNKLETDYNGSSFTSVHCVGFIQSVTCFRNYHLHSLDVSFSGN